jgi:hypothetical protein
MGAVIVELKSDRMTDTQLMDWLIARTGDAAEYSVEWWHDRLRGRWHLVTGDRRQYDGSNLRECLERAARDEQFK